MHSTIEPPTELGLIKLHLAVREARMRPQRDIQLACMHVHVLVTI